MNVTLHASPLQGFTDYRFRNAFQKHFGGIDVYYAPFIRLEKGKIKPKNERDILPENNADIKLIPQIVTRDADEFLWVAEFAQGLGYNEINWNLGCPYPMVAKRGLGSGLIAEPEQIASVLKTVTQKTNLKLSVKMRLGYENPDEIFQVLPVLNDFPLVNVAIHPRIGKQLYKGTVDLDRFEACLPLLKHTVIYNGDITSYDDYLQLSTRFPSIKNWMLGRGVMTNPMLAGQIHNGQPTPETDWKNRFFNFHQELWEVNEENLSGDHQVIQKMKPYWEYFSALFPNDKKALKKIKKAQNPAAYLEGVNMLRKY